MKPLFGKEIKLKLSIYEKLWKEQGGGGGGGGGSENRKEKNPKNINSREE